MMLSPWRPLSDFANLHGAMNRLFDEFFGDTWTGAESRSGVPTYSLPIDVLEGDKSYEVKAPLPGFSPDEVDVTFADGTLTISAERKHEKRQEEGSYVRREVGFANYRRQLTLPLDAKAEQIQARFENGVLTVEVPKEPRSEPVKIAVGGGSKRKALPES
jgi:HSP20 family protein